MSKKYVNRIQFCSYSTIFSCTGDNELALKSRVCFRDAFYFGNRLKKQHYEVILIRDPEYVLNSCGLNLCLLNAKEIKKHLWLARRLFGFSYSVEETIYNDFSAYKVILDIDAPYFYHKYLLTWLRYTYEFPFNLILNDALRMKHQYLPKESITNLFVLCANSYQCGPECYNTGHSISVIPSNFLKEYELKARINRIAAENNRYSMNVNNIYPMAKGGGWNKISTKEGGRYLDYWLDPETFDDRKNVYLDNYKRKIKK